jgi:hypothetical protein
MTRTVLLDEDAIEEAEAETRYYRERAGERVALRFAAEVEEIYRGLASGRFVGVNHRLVRFRLPLKRVFLESFPLRSCSISRTRGSMWWRWRRSAGSPGTGGRGSSIVERRATSELIAGRI